MVSAPDGREPAASVDDDDRDLRAHYAHPPARRRQRAPLVYFRIFRAAGFRNTPKKRTEVARDRA